MAERANSGGVRQRRSAEEWREIFEWRAASGLTITAFCQREGIAPSSYARWRTQLADAARDGGSALSPARVGFVDAGVLAHRATAEASARMDLTLELGHGIVLHVVRGRCSFRKAGCASRSTASRSTCANRSTGSTP